MKDFNDFCGTFQITNDEASFLEALKHIMLNKRKQELQGKSATLDRLSQNHQMIREMQQGVERAKNHYNKLTEYLKQTPVDKLIIKRLNQKHQSFMK